LRVTNLDKVLFPARPGEEPVTKRDLLRYTAQIAPTLLPYLTRRAVNLHRYPNGAQTKGFWHKELPDHAPDWLPRWDNPEAGPRRAPRSRRRSTGPSSTTRRCGRTGSRSGRSCRGWRRGATCSRTSWTTPSACRPSSAAYPVALG